MDNLKGLVWLDFGSLLGLLRDTQDPPFLGGDLDLGVRDWELTLDILRELELPLLIRKVGGLPMAIKVDIDPPIDIHIWRSGGILAHNCSGFMPDQINHLIRGAITKLKTRKGSIDQGFWPYRPVTWTVPDSYIGYSGSDYRGWPLPKKSLGLIVTHYGEDWNIPNKGPWVWYEAHRSIRRGLPKTVYAHL